MYMGINDLPTTLRETLSEVELELYLKAYRRAYESLDDEVDADARKASAHEAAMRTIENDHQQEGG
jgi:cation transport regulator ChaB